MSIKKNSSFWNPWSVDGKYELSNIKIFNPETAEVLYEHNQGWIDNCDELFLEGVKRKIKLNLTVKHPFFIKEHREYDRETKYCLYIPINDVNFRFDRNDIKYETDTDISYADFFKVDIDCEYRGEREVKTIEVFTHTNTEKKEFGKEVAFWTEKLGEDNIEIRSYDLEKLLKKYKLLERV
jgi:hypothetical protein